MRSVCPRQAPAAPGALVWSAFGPIDPAVPFDHTRPPATIKVHAKQVFDRNPRGYPKGCVVLAGWLAG
eukprot:SAG22_NODE_1_length_62449_cov_158.689270_5_plen_68_part_00